MSQHILNGCQIFIACSDGPRWAELMLEAQELRARVVPIYLKTATHIVLCDEEAKEKLPIKFAPDANQFVVSPEWLHKCKEIGAKVPEAEFESPLLSKPGPKSKVTKKTAGPSSENKLSGASSSQARPFDAAGPASGSGGTTAFAQQPTGGDMLEDLDIEPGSSQVIFDFDLDGKADTAVPEIPPSPFEKGSADIFSPHADNNAHFFSGEVKQTQPPPNLDRSPDEHDFANPGCGYESGEPPLSFGSRGVELPASDEPLVYKTDRPKNTDPSRRVSFPQETIEIDEMKAKQRELESLVRQDQKNDAILKIQDDQAMVNALIKKATGIEDDSSDSGFVNNSDASWEEHKSSGKSPKKGRSVPPKQAKSSTEATDLDATTLEEANKAPKRVRPSRASRSEPAHSELELVSESGPDNEQELDGGNENLTQTPPKAAAKPRRGRKSSEGELIIPRTPRVKKVAASASVVSPPPSPSFDQLGAVEKAIRDAQEEDQPAKSKAASDVKRKSKSNTATSEDIIEPQANVKEAARGKDTKQTLDEPSAEEAPSTPHRKPRRLSSRVLDAEEDQKTSEKAPAEKLESANAPSEAPKPAAKRKSVRGRRIEDDESSQVVAVHGTEAEGSDQAKRSKIAGKNETHAAPAEDSAGPITPKLSKKRKRDPDETAPSLPTEPSAEEEVKRTPKRAKPSPKNPEASTEAPDGSESSPKVQSKSKPRGKLSAKAPAEETVAEAEPQAAPKKLKRKRSEESPPELEETTAKKPKRESKPSEEPAEPEESSTAKRASAKKASAKHLKEQLAMLISTLNDGSEIQDSVSALTSHVVLGSEKRTFKTAIGIALGKWMVKSGWVDACVAAGRIVDPSPFEVTDWYPGAHASRLASKRIFEGLKFFIHGHDPKMPRGDLESLITAAGGALVSAAVHSDYVVTGGSRRFIRDVENPLEQKLHVVEVPWLMDSITKWNLEAHPNEPAPSKPGPAPRKRSSK